MLLVSDTTNPALDFNVASTTSTRKSGSRSTDGEGVSPSSDPEDPSRRDKRLNYFLTDDELTRARE
jgi:hypothetical protein